MLSFQRAALIEHAGDGCRRPGWDELIVAAGAGVVSVGLVNAGAVSEGPSDGAENWGCVCSSAVSE